jgi:hypothetical protein
MLIIKFKVQNKTTLHIDICPKNDPFDVKCAIEHLQFFNQGENNERVNMSK